LNQCRDMGIGILPPDVNSSDRTFSPSGQDIRFGLTAIKNVGQAAIESVLEARNKLGRFEHLFQFCENVDLRLLNKRVIESLIKAGAMDSLGAHRAQMIATLDRAIELGQNRQRQVENGQTGLFSHGSQGASEPAPPASLPVTTEWTETQRLAAEKEVLGFYVTGHPLEKYRDALRSLTPHDSASLEEAENDTPVTIAGMLTSVRIKPSRKGDLWASATLEDLHGAIELIVFPQALQQIQSLLKPDSALLIRGRLRREENAKPKIMVNEAQPLETAVNKVKPAVLIRLNLGSAPEGLLDNLESVFGAYPGESPIIFELSQSGDFKARLRCRKPAGVNASPEVLTRLQTLCGKEAVSVEQMASRVN
ncbi:MAG: OB-fold nucleic acid binding domain-containing protein, partial [Candidatus Acidiferrales bacterium]